MYERLVHRRLKDPAGSRYNGLIRGQLGGSLRPKGVPSTWVGPRGGVSPDKNFLCTPSPPPGKRCLKRQVMSTLTNYFTDIGMNCHIRLCVVSGLEKTLPDCLQHVVLSGADYNVSFFNPYYFFFSSFLCSASFPPLLFKNFLLRHSPSKKYIIL